MKAEASPTTPDPIEIAMEAEAKDASPDSPARRLLIDQGRLVRWQIADARMGAALKASGILVGLVVAALVGGALWQAHESRGLVIEAFDTPPAMAARGLTGKVIAAQLQDRLDGMQAETVSTDAAREVSSRWSGDIKVEIPNTGVSVGELDRLLRQWLGADVRVSGAVYRTGPADGLAMTARTSPGAGVRTVGTEAGMDALVQTAAEAVYGQTQPTRYADWLIQHGREPEAWATLRWLTTHGSSVERASAWLALTREPDTDRAEWLRRMERARALDPDNQLVLGFLSIAAIRLGHWEEAIARAARAEQLARRAPGLSADGVAYLTYVNRSNREHWLGAYLDSLADGARQAQYVTVETSALANRVLDAGVLAQNHDVAASRAAVAETPPPPANASTDERLSYERERIRTRALQLAELQDWAGVAAIAAAVEAQNPDALSDPTFLPAKAQALAGLGRYAEARTTIGASPLDCYPCVVMRARVAALSGDWPTAERNFALAETLGPSLPHASTQWAEFLLARGQPDAAIAKLKLAHRRSPRFGDPLELWGEALLAKGNSSGASAKFTEAAQLSPRWGRLHLKWGEALAKLGKADEARAKWRAATTMDLTASERARLQALTGKRTL